MIARMATSALKGRRRLGRHGRNAVPGSSDAAHARLRTHAASGPDRVRDLRHAVAGARQRDSRLPCAERRRARGRLREDAAAGEHARRLRRRGSRRQRRTRSRLVGRHDRSRQGLRHQPFLRRQHEPARRMPRHDRTVVDEPGDRPAVRIRLSRDHGRRHGPRGAGVSGRAGDHAARRGRRRIARRHAGARVGRPVPRSRRRDCGHREHARAAAAGGRVERGRAQRDHGGSRLAGRPLLRHRPRAERRHGRGADGRPHHVSVGEIARRQVRSPAAVRGRHPLHASPNPSSRWRTTSATRRRASSNGSTRTPTSTRRAR